MGLEQIVEIGIVSGSVEKTVAEFEKLGVTGWEFGEMDSRMIPESLINDKEDYYIIKSASHMHGNLAIEIIEPLSEGFFMDFLKERGTGVHHIAFTTKEEYIPFVEKFKADGGKMAMEVKAMKSFPCLGYMDTIDALGFFVELHNASEHKE